MKPADLYDVDFSEWARRNAELLRSGRVAEADLERIAEEIEDMSKRARSAVRTRLARLMQHLLKWRMQPEKRSRSWEKTIAEQRFRLHELLEENPSFQAQVRGWIQDVYPHAVRLAAIDTGIPAEQFPTAWAWSVEETLREGLLPGSPG